MPRIRKIEIQNFRGIQALEWCPSPGINCLIGCGDSGKSSVLDAIDLCLGARRNVQFTDADFHQLNVEKPISISITLGELDDALKNLDTYGLYVRGFDPSTGAVEDEPEKDLETVLTLRLTVADDLEPSWSLISERAQAQDNARNLTWGDRVRIAPNRIGAMADYHLGWRRGSVLNRISEERADASAALAKAARDARAAFGDQAQAQLGETLATVAATAKELGIAIGDDIKAMLDAHSVSFSGGTISLHDKDGIPLRNLGVGSTRLLIAGLQRKAAADSTIILIDELEHGLEPHRIMRLISSLGAKENPAPLQVFMTTHSPVALRELSGDQLYVTRPADAAHEVQKVGTEDHIQGTIRNFPEAFLAPSVIICEGASEIGLVRGIDQFRIATEPVESIAATGTALADCGGGGADRPFTRASAFLELGYTVAVLRDDDQKPSPAIEDTFKKAGGTVFTWRDGRALEDELFLSLSNAGVGRLVERAVELYGEEAVDSHIRSASQNAKNLATFQQELTTNISGDSRAVLARAAKSKSNAWFKSVSKMEAVGRDIVGPDLAQAEAGFREIVSSVFGWSINARG